MYDIIYLFIYNNLLNSTRLNQFSFTLMGQSTNMTIWLSHTLTILSIVIIVFALAYMVKWFFKLGSGLLQFR